MAKKKTRAARKTAGSSHKSSKAPLIAGAIGLAVAGGAGGYAVISSTMSAADNTNTTQSTASLEPEYSVTRYKLSSAKSKLAALAVRTSETKRSHNDNGLVPKDFIKKEGKNCKTNYYMVAGSLVNVVTDEGICKTQAGLLFDYYTGKVVEYEPSESSGGIDTEHIVAKENAWKSGGYRWNGQEWIDFANDGDVLMAVSDSENRSKGGRDAAD